MVLPNYQDQGKYLERPIRPLPTRRVSPAVPGERYRGDLPKQVEQLFEDQANTEGKLTDLENQVLVLRRQQDENQAAFSSRLERLQDQGRVTDEGHARRLDALETNAAGIDAGALQSLIDRFGQLEEKVGAVELKVEQQTAMRQSESADDISGLAAMGGWQGVVDRLRAEIKSVVESHDPNLTLQRVQSEIVQRFDSFSQILQAQQQEQEQRNRAQLRDMLDGFVQRLTAISGNSRGALEPGRVNQAFEQMVSSATELNYRSSTAPASFHPTSVYGGQSVHGVSSNYPSGSMNMRSTHPQNAAQTSVATLPPLSTDSYTMSHGGERASLRGSLSGGVRGMNQGYAQPHAHSYQAGTTSNISAFMGPGPSDSISQRHSVGHDPRGYDFGHTSHLAPSAEISIRSAATDGSVSSSTARDGGVPHSDRLNWPADRSILTSVATSAAGKREDAKGRSGTSE
ncbi:hypothetical protein NMY22_g6213 [Coprinellus aureogranulatus]|nr:hypothetical protein NMY22_g6213 [Coprinellus aureogranulatus]